MSANQEQFDRLTYDMFVDCNCNARAAARQLGISHTTVRTRVRRAVLRYGGDNYYNGHTARHKARP